MYPANFYKKIIKFGSRGKVSMVGAIIVSVLLPVLMISTAFDVLGLIDNPYFGFLLYVVMAPLLVVGLLLFILGGLFSHGKEDIGSYTVEYLKEQFTRPGRYTRIRRLLIFTSVSTLLLVFVVGVASYSSFKYTSSARFCGLFCHNVMQPQYTAYENSPHSRVTCVECHLGDGASWKERSRFTGLQQLASVVTGSYPKPILPPLNVLRPGRATCEKCHLPGKFHGSRLYTKDHFLKDEKNTHVKTVILMKVGSGDIQGAKAHGVHWHVSETQQIRYRAADPEREVIVAVRKLEKGKKDVVYSLISETEKNTQMLKENKSDGVEMRTMDCIDCHNRPTHIFLSADEALDKKLLTNIIPSYLPFIKRQALAVITKEYTSKEDARVGISRGLQNWYREHYPELIRKNPDLFERAIQGSIQAYEENVFPEMDVTWGIYKNNLGHKYGSGCFRCHGKLQEEKSGRVISSDCNLCHIIFAEDEEHPAIISSLQKLLQTGERNDSGREQ